MTAWESIQNTIVFFFLFGATIATGYGLVVACSIETDYISSLEQAEAMPDTTFYSDTLYSISGSFQTALQVVSFIELCEQRISVPVEQIVTEKGVIAIISEFIGIDMSLEMFSIFPVEVVAGIDASRIVITDYHVDGETANISVRLSLPDAEISRVRVDISAFEARIREGHVRNSLSHIMDYLVSASANAETRARESAVSAGILDEANGRARQEITLFLQSLGVTYVEFANTLEQSSFSSRQMAMSGGAR